MDFINGIVEYQFLRYALIAAVLSGVACGIIGTYIVSRRLVFLSGGITHASFGGIGIAYYLGQSPILGALVFSVLSSVGVEWLGSKGRLREDSTIGIMWSVGMAIGIIAIYLTPGYAPNLMTFLFGNILTVTTVDLYSLGALVVMLLAFVTFFMRPVMYVAFDRAFARSRGVRVGLVNSVMAVLMALTIVFSIRVVGIMLLISLLTIPTVTVNVLTKSFERIFLWSAVVGVAGNIVGLYLSYLVDIPAGAAAIFVLTLGLIVVKICVKLLTLHTYRKEHSKSENPR